MLISLELEKGYDIHLLFAESSMDASVILHFKPAVTLSRRKLPPKVGSLLC